jgi:hypothetical protein
VTTTTTVPAPAAPKKRRGRETVLDMVRTLAVVFALVLPMYLFHQGGPGDRKRLRPVDPTEVFAAYAHDVGGPVPSAIPPGWTCTVRDTETVAGVARVGYVVGDHYVEYAGSTGDAFLPDETGQAQRVGRVTVAGVVWDDYRNRAGAESLVLRRGTATVVVGGVRETATTAELETLAALVR